MSNIKHGYYRTRTWNSWRAMRKRCMDPNNVAYDRYGGRGIGVDPRWDCFVEFLGDMGERPEGTTLDRIDPNGNYCKVNCRWATPDQQADTTRKGRGRVYKNGNRWAVLFQGKNRHYKSFKTEAEANEYRKHKQSPME